MPAEQPCVASTAATLQLKQVHAGPPVLINRTQQQGTSAWKEHELLVASMMAGWGGGAMARSRRPLPDDKPTPGDAALTSDVVGYNSDGGTSWVSEICHLRCPSIAYHSIAVGNWAEHWQ